MTKTIFFQTPGRAWQRFLARLVFLVVTAVALYFAAHPACNDHNLGSNACPREDR